MSRDQLVFDIFANQQFVLCDGLEARDWQLDCLKGYRTSVVAWEQMKEPRPSGPHCFTIYAGTGSGKTKGAGILAAFMLNTKRVEQIVIVCPNRSIRNKTRKELLRHFGIDLVLFGKKKHSDGIPRMQQGYILTYGALMSDPTLHRKVCQATRTLVIFDEVHHLGDSGAWGPSAVEAFGNVAHVISLTGTPYRPPGDPRIPFFVNYEETEVNGILRFRPDYTYSLGRAVADGVCRKPLFVFHSGTVRMRMAPDAPEITADFDQKANQAVASLRLRGAVTYGSAARLVMLREALIRCRAEKRKAIIFLGGDTEGDHTPTQDATVFLPEELQQLGYTTDEFETVTGDDDDAQRKIESFGTHPTKWLLVSINMISEGTDVPEVSAAIFLTSITAKQTTVQRIGRALRFMGPTDPHADALIFMFKDPDMVILASEIDEEIRSEIDLRKKARDNNKEGGVAGERKARAEAIGISGGEIQMVKFQGEEYPVAVFEKARLDVQALGLPPTMLNAVLALRTARGKYERH